MVFESRVGETFLLGASTLAHRGDHARPRARLARARASRARCRSGTATRPGRPLELGRAHRRADARAARAAAGRGARRGSTRDHDLDARAAENLLQLPRRSGGGDRRACPTTARSSIERCRDELGDWRVCVLSPLGGRVHAPWAMAVDGARARRARRSTSRRCGPTTASSSASRRPTSRPIRGCCCPTPTRSRRWCVRQLGATALFAARFREAAGARAAAAAPPARAARAALAAAQARGRPAGGRRRATARFPILLETYRECLRDVFDLPALVDMLRADRSARDPRRHGRLATPSPFAASLLFGYVANFIYDGDAPLAERRAQALADRPGAAARAARRGRAARAARRRRARRSSSAQLQHLDAELPARGAPTACTTCCCGSATCRATEIARARRRPRSPRRRRRARRARGARSPVPIAGERAAHRGRGRGALPRRARRAAAAGPARGAARAGRAIRSATSRCATRARTARSPPRELAARFGLGARRSPSALLQRLAAAGRLLEGEFRPGGTRARVVRRRTCCAALRRRSLARLRQEVEPVEPRALGALRCRAGRASSRPRARARRAARRDRAAAGRAARRRRSSRREILPARVDGYQPAISTR